MGSLDDATKTRIRDLLRRMPCPAAAQVVMAWGLNGGEGEALDYLQEQAKSADESPGKPKSVATLLVELSSDIDFVHSPERDPYACIPVNGHRETWPIGSRPVRDYLANRYFRETGKAPSTQAVQDAIQVFRGRALFFGREMSTGVRVQEHAGKIYVDVCNRDWQAVLIEPGRWSVIDTPPPVLFRRPNGMLPLPVPDHRGTLDPLWQLLTNVAREDRVLVAAILAASLSPKGPYPVLVIGGEHGVGKSFLMSLIKWLIDPSLPLTRGIPRDEHDFMIAAQNQWVLALDNLSSISPEVSDILCRLATGAGMTTRELYSDGDEKIFSSKRLVLLNGIGEPASRPDLLDRAIVIQPVGMSARQRKQERELWQEAVAMQPQILGALFNAVAAALANQGAVHLERSPRMADFAAWAAAVLPELGFTVAEFLDRYDANRAEVNSVALEASPIGPVLQQVVTDLTESGPWEGTYSDLLSYLNERADMRAVEMKGWPKNARSLSVMVSRLAPSLREVTGVRAAANGRTNNGRLLLLDRTVEGEDVAKDAGDANPPICSVGMKSTKGEGRTTENICDTSGVSVTTQKRGFQEGDANDRLGDASGPRIETGDKPEKPSRCGNCGSGRFWRRPDGGWVCAVCHPSL